MNEQSLERSQPSSEGCGEKMTAKQEVRPWSRKKTNTPTTNRLVFHDLLDVLSDKNQDTCVDIFFATNLLNGDK